VRTQDASACHIRRKSGIVLRSQGVWYVKIAARTPDFDGRTVVVHDSLSCDSNLWQ